MTLQIAFEIIVGLFFLLAPMMCFLTAFLILIFPEKYKMFVLRPYGTRRKSTSQDEFDRMFTELYQWHRGCDRDIVSDVYTEVCKWVLKQPDEYIRNSSVEDTWRYWKHSEKWHIH